MNMCDFQRENMSAIPSAATILARTEIAQRAAQAAMLRTITEAIGTAADAGARSCEVDWNIAASLDDTSKALKDGGYRHRLITPDNGPQYLRISW